MLLTEADPPPFTVLREGGRSDIFLTADHAGRAVPAALGDLGVPPAEMDRHIAWDIGIAGVTRHLSAMLDATAILQTYSRLVIDCNRDPSWPSAMPGISEYTPVPGNTALSADARRARTEAVFAPYHDKVRALLDARAGRPTIYVAMHSFTPSFKGESRAMHVGVLFNKHPRFSQVLLALLRAEPDLVVGENAPYAITDNSDYSVPVHAEARGLPHTEIEIRQDLIAEPDGQRAWAERFARLLTAARDKLVPSDSSRTREV